MLEFRSNLPSQKTDARAILSRKGSALAVDVGNRGAFPLTDWSQLAAVRGDDAAKRSEALSYLAERYWRPLYCYALRRGCSPAEAEDSVQGFFLTALSSELFAKADPTRGRFRSLLLKSMEHFLNKEWRQGHAAKRHPSQGFRSIREMATESGQILVPKDTRTPEDAFHHAWIGDLVLRVLRALEQEYSESGKSIHIALLRERVILPILDGTKPTSPGELADRYSLTIEEVGNRVVTARRAYQRLLREEIRLYASSEEEVAAEIRDIWHFAGG